MLGKEVYKIWAPFSNKWSSWVRPVPFVSIKKDKVINESVDYKVPNINYLDGIVDNMAVVVDLDGGDSIKEGIALAKLGYRPIPIFNGTSPNSLGSSVVNNTLVEPFLIWGAIELKNIVIDDNALPVFLLDSNRLNRYKFNRSVFDNSWDVYPQDMPSFSFFLDNNINKILVVSDAIHRDLNKILYKYQKNNIQIFFTDRYDEIKRIKVKKVKLDEF